MLTKDQATILLDHVVEALHFSHDGEIIKSTVCPENLSEVADAVASLQSISNGDDTRDALIRLLRDLPSLCADLNPRVAEMLAALGEPSQSDPGIRRCGRVEIHVAGSAWIPSEVVAALARIAEAVFFVGAPGARATLSCTPASIAAEVERAMSSRESAAQVLREVRALLKTLDPDREGAPTVHEVQVATETVQRLLSERPGQWVERTEGGVRERVRVDTVMIDRAMFNDPREVLSVGYTIHPSMVPPKAEQSREEQLLAENRQLRARLDELSGWPSLDSYPRRFGCWWADSDVDPEVTEVVSRSPRDAAISFFMRKVSEHHVHQNVPDRDRIGVVEFETGDSQIIGVRITVDTDVEGA